MKILQVSSGDLKGGADIAGFRLMQALESVGADVQMLVRHKVSHHPAVSDVGSYPVFQLKAGAGTLDKLPGWATTQPGSLFSLGTSLCDMPRLIRMIAPDIVHLHWPHNGMLDIADVPRLGVPVVWTLHDMWTFTGGCHYTNGCLGFHSDCADCPQIRPVLRPLDIAGKILKRKKKHWQSASLRFVTPSEWMAREARSSSLIGSQFPVQAIPNPIDSDTFCASGRDAERERLKLRPDEKAILFINGGQQRKGADIIPTILNELARRHPPDALTVIFLGSQPEVQTPFRIISVPALSDQAAIARVYSASDVYVLPTLQENLPNVIVEALCCEVPVAAFATGGVPEMIDAGKNGITVETGNAQALAEAISTLLAFPREQRPAIREQAVLRYSRKAVAEACLAVYREMLGETA